MPITFNKLAIWLGCTTCALGGSNEEFANNSNTNESKCQTVGQIDKSQLKNIPSDSRLFKKCPSLAASIVTKVYEKGKFVGVLLIDRGRPPLGQALPGGLVRYEETCEGCAKRTLFDECGIVTVANLKQFNVYSNPQRDPRMHVIDTVFTARADDVKLSAGTDAKHAWVCPIDQIPWDKLVFDHREILKNALDYELSLNDCVTDSCSTQLQSVSVDRTSRNNNDFTAIAKKSFHPPFSAASVIIEMYEKGVFKGIVLIDRGKDPIGKAIPGGHVEYGEMIDYAARREMKEECNLELKDLRLFKAYSDKDRDPRKHTVDFVHIARVDDMIPKAGDDASKVYVFSLDQIPFKELVFDHAKILNDYLNYRKGIAPDACIDCRCQVSVEKTFLPFEKFESSQPTEGSKLPAIN